MEMEQPGGLATKPLVTMQPADLAVVYVERGHEAEVRVEKEPISHKRQQIMRNFVAAADGGRVGGTDRGSPKLGSGRCVEAGDIGGGRDIALPHGHKEAAAIADGDAVERPGGVLRGLAKRQ